MKATISISDELLKKVDERAKAMYLSRSAFITMALTQKMQSDDAIVMLPALTKTMNEAMKFQREQEGKMALPEA